MVSAYLKVGWGWLASKNFIAFFCQFLVNKRQRKPVSFFQLNFDENLKKSILLLVLSFALFHKFGAADGPISQKEP